MGLGSEGLDCAMFMNLERRKDRYWFCYGRIVCTQFQRGSDYPFCLS